MRLRIRTHTQTHTVSLDDSASLGDLQAQITALTGIQNATIKYGFPPRPLEVSDPNASLPSVGITSGDSLTVQEGAASVRPAQASGPAVSPPVSSARPAEPNPPSSSQKPRDIPQAPNSSTFCVSASIPQLNGHMVLRKTPDDNSCLFSSIAVALDRENMGESSELRQNIASVILSDPESYSEVVLGMPPSQYIEKILLPDTWGGAIELAIFSKLYAVQVVSVDVQTGISYTFGEDMGYSTKVFVIYSGIHYDTVSFTFTDPHSIESDVYPPVNLDFDTTVFPTDEPLYDTAVQTIVSTLRSQHAYTDTASFQLRCEVCNLGLTGEKEARQHANQTGHVQFGEY